MCRDIVHVLFVGTQPTGKPSKASERSQGCLSLRLPSFGLPAPIFAVGSAQQTHSSCASRASVSSSSTLPYLYSCSILTFLALLARQSNACSGEGQAQTAFLDDVGRSNDDEEKAANNENMQREGGQPAKKRTRLLSSRLPATSPPQTSDLIAQASRDSVPVHLSDMVIAMTNAEDPIPQNLPSSSAAPLGQLEHVTDTESMPAWNGLTADLFSNPVPSLTGTGRNAVAINSEHDLLIWNALGLDENARSDYITESVDIPWLTDYNWLADCAPSFAVNEAEPDFQAESIPPNPSQGGHAKSMVGIDASLLVSMLQDIQPQSFHDLHDSFQRRTAGMTPSHSVARSRAISPNAAIRGEEDSWPMNWRSPNVHRPAIGEGNSLIVDIITNDVPHALHSWEAYWIDAETYERVKKCFGKLC